MGLQNPATYPISPLNMMTRFAYLLLLVPFVLGTPVENQPRASKKPFVGSATWSYQGLVCQTPCVVFRLYKLILTCLHFNRARVGLPL